MREFIGRAIAYDFTASGFATHRRLESIIRRLDAFSVKSYKPFDVTLPHLSHSHDATPSYDIPTSLL